MDVIGWCFQAATYSWLNKRYTEWNSSTDSCQPASNDHVDICRQQRIVKPVPLGRTVVSDRDAVEPAVHRWSRSLLRLLSDDEASPALSRLSLSKWPVAVTIVVAVVRFTIIAASACRSAASIRAACSQALPFLGLFPFVFVRCDVLFWTMIIKP